MGFKKDYSRYENLLQDYRPTIRSFLFNLFLKKFVEKNRHKQIIEDFSKPFDVKYLFPDNLVYVALVQDERVKEMIRIDKETADLIISDQTQFVFFNKDSTPVKLGMKYKNNKFMDAENNGENDEKN